jgi:hypothetical protein
MSFINVSVAEWRSRGAAIKNYQRPNAIHKVFGASKPESSIKKKMISAK